MSSYLLINILIIAIPVVLSFERKVQFYRRLPSVLISVIVVGAAYIVWDIAATARGDWAFHHDHVMDIRLLGLPIEEILFFVIVPYACIFIYEVLRSHLNDRILPVPGWMMLVIPVPFIIVALGTQGQPYTQTVFLFTAGFFILCYWTYPLLLQSKLFWVFMAITFVPFFIVNYMLTSIPVVTYGDGAFSGIRITTIPLEDFFYSFSMLAFNLYVYKRALKLWQPHLP